MNILKKVFTRGLCAALTWSVVSVATGCGGREESRELHTGSRDNISPAAIVSIDERLPAIHDGVSLYIFGDTMVIKDSRSTELMFTAYDIVGDSCLGSFGMFGAGPGETLGIDHPFFDPVSRQMYGLEEWRIMGFDLDSAVADPGYKAYVKLRIDTVGSVPALPKGPVYINDTTIIASRVVFRTDRPGYRENPGVFNLLTGEMKPLAAETEDDIKCAYAVSPDGELIVEAGRRGSDRIRLLDRSGNVVRTIYGPRYDDGPAGREFYYMSPVVTDDRIYVIYYDRDSDDTPVSDIIEMDLNGRYIRSMRSYERLISLGYHKPTGRLYVSSSGEPQFGYIAL